MNNTSATVEQLITRYFVRYERLDQLIPMAFSGYTRTKRVNIIIDLYGLYKTMFSRTYRTIITDYTAFTVTIINMCAHYRSYFKSIGVSTKFFIVSSYNIPELNIKFVAEYNKTFREKLKNKQIGEMVDINLGLLDLLCPYLPDIHIFKTQFESTIMMKYLIDNERELDNKDPWIILSSDIYPMQLCTLPDVVFLKPKKLNGSDISMITCPYGSNMHEDSFWSIVCQDFGILASDKSKVLVTSPNYMLLMSVTRFPERNFKNLMNFNKGNQVIHSAIGYSNNKIDFSTLYQYCHDDLITYPYASMESRYKCLDIGLQYDIFSQSLESKIIKYNNLWDPDAIQTINNKYFAKNPIDVFRL